MINPSISNILVQFSSQLFPKSLVKKYNDFLFQRNEPFNNITDHIIESIVNVEIPGFAVVTKTVTSNNTGSNSWQSPGSNTELSKGPQGADGFAEPTINIHYAGNEPLNETIESTTISITMKNTILNYIYFYEFTRLYYKRTRAVKEFAMTMTIEDAAEIPIINFVASQCFISMMPALEFDFRKTFNEAQTFTIQLTFNRLDVNLAIPSFKQKVVNLEEK